MERYEAYRDSGVEWMCDVPIEWDVAAAKRFIAIENGSDPQLEGDVSVYGSSGIAFKFCGESKEGPTVLLGRKGTIDNPSYIEGEYWNVDTAFNVAKRSDGLSLKYYYYQSTCFDYAKFQTATAVPSMTQQNYGDMKIVIPSLCEQHAIVEFLDMKVAEIDSLIEQTERSIELLEEYRKSVISEAVTKGFNSDVPMKDSGIEWIGKIPEHWIVSKIKYEFINHDNLRKPIEASLRSQNSETLYPYYGASGIVDVIDDYIFDGRRILIGEDGANLVLRNLPLVYVAEGKYWVNNHAHTLEPSRSLDFDYAAHQLELIDLTDYITGSAQPKLSQANLGRIPVVVPPVKEQEAIVERINSLLCSLEESINAKKLIAERFKEYRKSLIYEAVTGKFKVPGVE